LAWMSRLGVNRPLGALSLGRTADALGNSVLLIVIPLYVARIPDLAFHLPVPVLAGIIHRPASAGGGGGRHCGACSCRGR
jgi:hypothetical protein